MKPEEAIELLRNAAGHEEKLTLAAVEIAIGAHPVELQGRLRESVYAAAVPHWFHPAVLCALVDGISSEEAEHLHTVLKGFSFVEKFAARNACNVHERTRLALLRWMAREQPHKYLDLSLRAARFFTDGSEPYAQIEHIYHALVVEPGPGSNRLGGLYDQWQNQGRVERLQALAAMVEEHLAEKRLTGRALAMALDVAATIEWNYRPLAQTEIRLTQSLYIYRQLEDERAQSVILDEIGDVQRARGHLDDALGSFQASLAIAEKLAAHDPANTEWQRDLSISHEKIGDVQRAREHLDDALGSFQASLAIREKLAADDPANTEWQRDLSISHEKIGDVQRAREHLDDALGSFQASLA
ncbi:MAG: hypothetical protein H0W30_19585, partial [Gemmatimonadaceae bacterium]|nr:hypothetical protein [Gemmatimonadaceae bacterium]